MKLKLVVTLMSALGVVSCPAFADTTTTTHVKHKHHHHKTVRHHAVVHHDYKDMGNMPVAPIAVCSISQTSMIMDQTTQSIGRSMPSPCNPGWFNRIQLSGGLNVDLGKFGNRNANYMGENYQRLSLNDAYLNIAAQVNDWAKAFASISYNTASVHGDYPTDLSPPVLSSEFSSAYSNNVNNFFNNNSSLQLEQAYATFGNFDASPVYLQVGKAFQDFSRYEIHPITRSLTQDISEVLATALKVGFILPMGFNGGVYVFDDQLAKVGQTSKTTNYGIALGYDQPSDQFGWDVGAAYLYNLIGANDVAYRVTQYNALAGGGYNTRTGGVALYADVNSGPFVLGARYTSAVQRFNALDLPKNGTADIVFPFTVSPTATGAKPWAAGIQAGYGFEAWDRNQNIYIGFQASRQAAGLGLPKDRWALGYDVAVFGRDTKVGIEWDHDMAYSVGNGGTNNNTNLISVRSSVKFG